MSSNKLFLKKKDGNLIDIEAFPGLVVNFLGEGSTVTLAEGSIIKNSWIKVGDNSQVVIDKTAPRGINNAGINMEGSAESKLSIAQGFSVESCYFGMANETGLKVIIGENCMFSGSIQFSVTDGHIIYDMTTKELLNKSKPIILGNHIWLGHSVIILKGSVISDNSVVGAGAVVAKVFHEKNIIIAGNPARIIKKNINWDKKYIDKYNIRSYQNIQDSDALSSIDIEGPSSSRILIASRVFSLLFWPFISSRHRKKLENNPVSFFHDSKHPITRGYGKLFGII